MTWTPGTEGSAAAEAARTELEAVTDPTSRATVLALLAIAHQLGDLTRMTRSLLPQVKQLNQYLGAIANKP